MHIFAGASGIAIGVATPVALFAVIFRAMRGYDAFNMDVPRKATDDASKPGSFESILTKYLKITEVVVGLAAGSIVLLVGSSALHGGSQSLPWFYATPLFLLAFAILYGIAFSVWLILKYETYQHRGTYSRIDFSISNALGFAGLFCFVLGYLWLIFRVTT